MEQQEKKKSDITLECVSGAIAGVAAGAFTQRAVHDYFEKELDAHEFTTALGKITGVKNMYEAIDTYGLKHGIFGQTSEIRDFRTQLHHLKEDADDLVKIADQEVAKYTVLAAVIAGVAVAGIAYLIHKKIAPDTDVSEAQYSEKVADTELQEKSL
jgi:hypothetical protein